MQIILLGLFIYPLYKQNFCSIETPFHKSQQQKIKKAAILATICLVCDILLPLSIKVFMTSIGITTYTFYNVSMVVNQLVTIACFDK